MSNPYETMWKVLAERVQTGKTGWGKNEVLSVMREIELGVWRGNYMADRICSRDCSEAELEQQADLELDKAIDNGLMDSESCEEIPQADLEAVETILNELEESRIG